ncbi:MAG: GNAT family N-acetyltransferase [Gammaproteobacteria bacterium]|nr:GNAT family N-acetyltransferase [Gammaproteobacteria bacterium]
MADDPPRAWTIRVAETRDVPTLAGWRYDFRAAETRAQEPRAAFIDRCVQWMHARLAEPDRWHAWIAQDDTGPAGQIWTQIFDKVPNPVDEAEAHAYITNLYVRPSVRGTGIGAALLHTAIDWCRTRGVHSVLLWAPADRHALYLRHGFVSPAEILELADGAPPGARA